MSPDAKGTFWNLRLPGWRLRLPDTDTLDSVVFHMDTHTISSLKRADSMTVFWLLPSAPTIVGAKHFYSN